MKILRKGIAWIPLVAIMIAFAIGMSVADTPRADANGTNWWHSLSQASRNQLIVDTGKQDIGKVTDTCKEWVRTVVKNASQHVVIPANQPSPNDWMWVYDPNGHVVGMSAPLENVQVGWIVQMKLKSGSPHTAIIAGKTSDGIYFLDSNWSPDFDRKVRLHFMTYKDFYGILQSPGSYSVYYIL